MESEVTVVADTSSNQEPTNSEDVRAQLLKSEQQKEKLRTNLKKLKEKMIDTNMMVNLFTKTKEALRQTELKLEEERKEKTNLRLQLEQVLQETQLLKDKLSEASSKNISLQTSLDKVQAQLRSTLAFNSQLKAEVEARASSKDELESLKKECKTLKKDFQTKANRVSVLEADITTLKRQLDDKKKEVAMLEERNKELQTQQPFSLPLDTSPEKPKRKSKSKEQEREKGSAKKRKVKKEEEVVATTTNKFEPITDASYPVPVTEFIGADLNEPSDSETELQINQIMEELSEEESEHDEIEISLGAPIPCPVNPLHTRNPSESLFEYVLRQVSQLQDTTFDDTLIALTEELPRSPDVIHNLADAFVVALKSRPRKSLFPEDDLVDCLLWYILESMPSIKQNALEYLLQHLASLILTAPDERIEDTVPLCALFTRLCKFGGDVERVRVLLYDALRERPFMEIWTVAAIASVWPHSLTYQHDASNILLKTVESIVTFFCQELQPDSKELKMYHSIKSACQWKLVPSDVSFETLVSEAVKIITSAESKDQIHNAVKCLELIASNQGWPWCYNTIVVGHLWPLMQPGKYSHTAMLTAVRLFGILGRTVISSLKAADVPAETSMLQSAANMDGIVLLRNRLEMILSRQVIQFSLDVEVMAALSLVDLSFGLPQHLTRVKSWAAGLTADQQSSVNGPLQKVLQLIL